MIQEIKHFLNNRIYYCSLETEGIFYKRVVNKARMHLHKKNVLGSILSETVGDGKTKVFVLKIITINKAFLAFVFFF